MDTVLVVDDNPRILKMMDSVRERHKDEFELIIANSGEMAISILQETNIDLVITDLVMPQIDGLTLLTRINELSPRTMCIAMTGYATDTVIKMLPDNLLRLIQKPFKVYELVAIINESLKTKPPAGSVEGISIASFLQLIEMDEKSCALDVILSDREKGTFLFKEGVLYDAFFEGVSGEEAALKILNHSEKADFTLHPLPKPDIPRRINRQLMEVLLKASRQRDDTP